MSGRALTDALRTLALGEVESQRGWDAVRGIVARRFRKNRSHVPWERLGLPADREQALDELTAVVFSHLLVTHAKVVAPALTSGDEVEGLLLQMVDQCITDLHRKHDVTGYGAWCASRLATAQLVDGGEAACRDHPQPGLSRPSVVAWVSGAIPHAAPDDLVATLGKVEHATDLFRRVPLRSQRTVRELLRALRSLHGAGRLDAYVVGVLTDALRDAANALRRSDGLDPAVVARTRGDDDPAAEVDLGAWCAELSAVDDRESFDRRIDRICDAIDAQPKQERVRTRAKAVLLELAERAAERFSDPPSPVEVCDAMGIKDTTRQETLRFLRDVILELP